MAEQRKTYVCSTCGQEVKVLKAGVGTLVCCNKPMNIKKD
ncbi:MAG: desulfoferrodoxin FeS4 iron-binding domain-containing protein [Candidatus Aminicenantia bacterium]